MSPSMRKKIYGTGHMKSKDQVKKDQDARKQWKEELERLRFTDQVSDMPRSTSVYFV